MRTCTLNLLGQHFLLLFAAQLHLSQVVQLLLRTVEYGDEADGQDEDAESNKESAAISPR